MQPTDEELGWVRLGCSKTCDWLMRSWVGLG